MKHLNLFVPVLAAVAALFVNTASAADEKEDLLARFDRELLIVMSGFYEAREATVATPFRQTYLSTFNQFVRDGEALQNIVVKLGIGEDLNIDSHVQNIRMAFQNPPKKDTSVSANQNRSQNRSQNRNSKTDSSVKKANDPLSRITGQSLGDYVGLSADYGDTSQGAVLRGIPIGTSFHMIGEAIQTISSVGFGLRNGKYSVSAKYRDILPYLEFKRDINYYNISYENFDTLIEIPVWRSDFEKRLKRMEKLAIQIQPIYRAYFPDKTISITSESERLSRVYRNYIDFIRIEKDNEKKPNKDTTRLGMMEYIHQLNYQEKGQILKDYDTAANRLAEFIADMESIDWTVKPFSADAPSADGSVKAPSKTSN